MLHVPHFVTNFPRLIGHNIWDTQSLTYCGEGKAGSEDDALVLGHGVNVEAHQRAAGDYVHRYSTPNKIYQIPSCFG